MGRKDCSGMGAVWGEEKQCFCGTVGGCRVIVSIQVLTGFLYAKWEPRKFLHIVMGQ